MRLIVTLVLLAAGAPGEQRVSGVLSRTDVTMPCLGGAAVTEEMIERKESILAKTTFTLLAGNARTGKVVARVKTDARGRYVATLPAGTYCVALGEVESAPLRKAGAHAAVAADPNVDADCLAEVNTPRCDAVLRVPDAKAGAATEEPVVIVATNQCPQPWAQPCWRGPMPPSVQRP